MNFPTRLALAFALAAAASSPALRADEPGNAFAAIFSSHAVLQRGCPLPVWGTAVPGSAVSVSLDGTARETRADVKGRWKVVFDAQTEPGAGHTLSLSVAGGEPVVLEDIAIGDVWICAGEGDMEMNFWSGVTNGDEELADSEYPDLRLFRVGHALSFRPAPDVRGSWNTANRDTVRPFSALAFFFGRAVYQNLGVPVGVVDVSRGGTIAETWLSVNRYSAIPGCKQPAEARRQAIHAWEHGGAEAFAKRKAEWEASYDGADPYEGADMQPWAPAFAETDWREVEMPSTFETGLDSPQFDGVVWYRHTFELTAAQAAAAGATLHLGTIDDNEATWLNGVKIGETAGAGVQRNYALPAGALRAGANVLVVRAHDTGGTGGFTGKPENLVITFGEGDPVPLAGTWRARGKKIPAGPRPTDPNTDPNAPGFCFNGMIAPLFPLPIRGILWSHGNANVEKLGQYPALVKAIAEEWRAGFSGVDGNIPFLLAENGSFEHNHRDPFETNWPLLRWTQAQIGGSLENSGAVATLDTGHSWESRTHNKRAVGDRLARLAMVRAYGDDSMEWSGPLPVSATLEDGKVVVTFSHAYILETSDEKPPAGFQLAGEDGKFAWAPAAEVVGETVVLDVPEGMTPVRVRHAWDHNPTRNLVGTDGLPCTSFELPVQAKL